MLLKTPIFPPLEYFWYYIASLEAILDAMMEFK